MDNFIYLFESIFNSIYVGLLVYSYWNAFCKPTIDNLIAKINNIESKQKLLYLISIDDDLNNEQTEHLKQIQKEINSIKKILESNRLDYHLDSDDPVHESEDKTSDDSIPYSKNKLPLHIQNHVTFPHFFIFNKKNFKQTNLHNNTYQLRFIGHDLRLLSNQLAKFLNLNSGTCMEFDEAYNMVYEYIQDADITNIGDDSKLSRLFGISENEDYEFSDSMLIKVLKNLLEPHFKTITYECVDGK